MTGTFRLSLIVAMAENRVIGRDGDLPWRLSTDLKRFKRLTMGHHLLMGRKTFDSIGRALPGRTSVVISRQSALELPEGVLRSSSLEGAIERAREGGDDEAFVIGGGQIYALALPRADRLYLTRVHARVEGDTYFPEVDFDPWEKVETLEVEPEGEPPYASTFEIWQRKAG